VNNIQGITTLFGTFSSLTPIKLAAILNLARIRINFALEKNTT
jgi:hypothetical protein